MIRRRGAWAVVGAALAMIASDGASARAMETTTLVYVPGGMSTLPVIVQSATGGTVTAPPKTTAPIAAVAMKLPLVVTRGLVDSRLLQFAMLDMFYPASMSHPALKAETYENVGAGAYQLDTVRTFADVAVSQVTLPGTYGNATQHGPLVVTVDVANSSTTTPAKTIGKLPAVHTEPPPAQAPVWAFQLKSFSNGKTMPIEGYFTFEPIVFTSSSTTSPVAITLHGANVTTQQVTDWAKLHANGGAILAWRQPTTGAATLEVDFKNVNVVSVKDNAGAEVHLTALVDTVTVR